MPGEKLRQPVVARFEQDGEIAAVDQVTRRAQRFYAFDKIAKLRNHFWRAAGKIDCRNLGPREPIDHAINRLAGHDFFALGAGVYVAMHAS